jgi:hypothetical protein
METSDAIRFAGQTVTFSFYAKAGANYSPTSSLLGYRLASGTGTDQNLLTGGYTGNVNLLDSTQAITTTYTRYSFTATVGSTATELGLFFYSTPTGTAGANDWFEITGVQLEIGSTATPFSRAGGTIQGELAACQRYYYRNTGGTVYSTYGVGVGTSSTSVFFQIKLPVTMRTRAAAIDYANLSWWAGGAVTSFSTATISSAFTNFDLTVIDATTTGVTLGNFYQLVNNNNAAGFLGISAEL